ncbi:MAG: hypothetical protein R3E98_06565 [Gemmatimonadota bacterium]
MCNASNHPAGCECGFGPGPPRRGSIAYGTATTWPEEIISEPWLLRRGLEDLSWDERGIEQFLSDYNALLAQDLPRPTVVGRIREMLGRRRMVVEERWRQSLEVPLYRFSAPNARGAKVTYSELYHLRKASGWSVKVFGIGTGHTREVVVAKQREFIALSGECQQVFVPIPLRLERIAVYDGRDLVGRGVRGEVDPPRNRTGTLARRGCRTISPGLCRERPDDPAEDSVTLLLAGQKSQGIHVEERRWSSDLGADLGMNLKLKKLVDIGPFVRVRRLRELSLKFELPSGTDYLGHLCNGRLWWERP